MLPGKQSLFPPIHIASLLYSSIQGMLAETLTILAHIEHYTRLPGSVQLYPNLTTDDVQLVSPVHLSTEVLLLQCGARPRTAPTR